MILSEPYFRRLRAHFTSYGGLRRAVIKDADDALHHAKRAIFAMHRDGFTEAKEKLGEAEKLLGSIADRAKKDPRLDEEGSFRAALEEYAEAAILYQCLKEKKIGVLPLKFLSEESFIAGLCDVPGELYRYAIKSATQKDFAMVNTCAEIATDIIGELVEYNLTSYLRTKFDQAKQALHKLEQVVYEVSLRN